MEDLKSNKKEQPKANASKPAVESKGNPRRANSSSGKRPRQARRTYEKEAFDVASWVPKTELGIQVKNGEITNIDQIFQSGRAILDANVVEVLIPSLETDLLLIGQAKGKFGGGQRRIFRQTQKKTKEGNKPSFATYAVVGNKDGFVGIGYGKSRETVPAREKSFRNAKVNLIKIRRGCGSWECSCGTSHSIPFAVEGKCGSTKIRLMPAPKGTGLCVEKECAKVLKLAGIEDVWSITSGQTKVKTNLIFACFEALKKLMAYKIKVDDFSNLSITEGANVKLEE